VIQEEELELSGYRCRIRQNKWGVWLGYLAVSPGHPFYGQDMEGLARLDVHGGVTFAETGADGLHWIGFDCAHLGDFVASMPELWEFEASVGHPGATIKTRSFMKKELEGLVAQAKAAVLCPEEWLVDYGGS